MIESRKTSGTTRIRRPLVAALALACIASACSDGSTAPTPPDRMESVAGDDQPGFVSNPLEEQLVVRVLDAENNPLENVLVTWTVTQGGGSVTPSQSRSDAAGLARTTWTLGPDEGEQAVTANISGLESITFSATASSLGPTCTGFPLDLTVGESVLLQGTQASELCVSGGAAVRDYLVVAFNTNRAASGGTLAFSVTTTGTGPVVGPPLPSPAVEPQVMEQPEVNDEFHMRIRRMERDELAPKVNPVAAGEGVTPDHGALYSLSNPAVGEQITLNTNANSSCSNAVNVTGRVVAITQRAIVIEDIGNPSGGFTSAEYQSIGATFDTLVYPLGVDNFGTPADIDNNSRIVLFYTKEVNELTPAGSSGGYIAGFFFARDLFPRNGSSRLQACAGSNQAEMFYLMVPDPLGTINGNQRDKDFVRRRTIATVAHEFQHLINGSRRLFVNTSSKFPEQGWVEEGLAHAAEELLFLHVAGLSTGQNIGQTALLQTSTRRTAFNDYQIENVQRVLDHLRNTETNSPFQSVLDLSTRGAAYWFLRYAVDRKGGNQTSTWRALVNSPDTGFKNIENVIAADPVQWMRDWAVSHYADDAVSNISERFMVQTWNLRSVVGALEPATLYPIRPVVQQNGVPRASSLIGGGSDFFRFGVPIGGQGRLVVAMNGGASVPPAMSVVVMRTR